MFYHWLAPLGKTYIIFNLFNYISFRAAGATVTALLLAFLVGPPVIAPAAGAEGGPGHPRGRPGEPPEQARHARRWAASSSSSPPSSRRCSGRRSPTASSSWRCFPCSGWGASGSSTTTSRSCRESLGGWWRKWKLAGQVSFGLLLGLFLAFHPLVPGDTIPATATTLPFFKYLVVNFAPWLYVALRDRGDHRDQQRGEPHRRARWARQRALPASRRRPSPTFAYLFGRVDVTGTSTSSICPAPESSPIFCAALMGATVGFLWFNAHPAQVFMGDTGSLAIGGALGTVAILLKAEFLLLLIGGVFAAEAVSVLAPDRHLQVVQADPRAGVRRRPSGLPHGAAAPSLREARLGGDHGRHPVLHPRALLRAGGALDAQGALT